MMQNVTEEVKTWRTSICPWCKKSHETALMEGSDGICEECARRELAEFEKTLEEEEKC